MTDVSFEIMFYKLKSVVFLQIKILHLYSLLSSMYKSILKSADNNSGSAPHYRYVGVICKNPGTRRIKLLQLWCVSLLACIPLSAMYQINLLLVLYCWVIHALGRAIKELAAVPLWIYENNVKELVPCPVLFYLTRDYLQWRQYNNWKEYVSHFFSLQSFIFLLLFFFSIFFSFTWLGGCL